MPKYDLIVPEDKDTSIRFEFPDGHHLELFKIGRNRLLIGGSECPMVSVELTHGKVSVAIHHITDVPAEEAFYQAPEFDLKDWAGLWERKMREYARRFGWDGRMKNILLQCSARDQRFFTNLGYKNTRPWPSEFIRLVADGHVLVSGIGPTYLQRLQADYKVIEREILEGEDG